MLLNIVSKFILILAVIRNIDCGLFDTIYCKFYECCHPPYLANNFTLLENKLSSNLFGQPLVKDIVINSIKAHLTAKNPQKALVLVFHGTSGTGKSFVADIIAESLYYYGFESRFFKKFSAIKDFPHEQNMAIHKKNIKESVIERVKECGQSLFVFDEIDKIPIGLIDVLKPYTDYEKSVDGIDYRRSIFIFLSNGATKEITKLTLELELQNVQREKFVLTDFHKIIENYLFNHKNDKNEGMYKCQLIKNKLIDEYVPFLPLERKHVKMCIHREFKNHGVFGSKIEQYVDNIANQMIFEPEDTKKFSTAGCKHVAQLVGKFISKMKIKTEL